MDSNYDVDFVDAGLPEIAREVWRGHGVVQKHLFFLQMHAQYLLGPLAEQRILAALAIVAGIVVCVLLGKKSYPSVWWYKDSEGMVRGPFSTPCMMHWSAKGYLPDDLEIKYKINANFAPLRELFPEPAVPFQSPPTPPPRSKIPAVKEVLADATEDGTLFEQEVSADMLRAQHEAFESRAQDLEDEMIMTLEADLMACVQSDDVSQQAICKEKEKDLESWNSSGKPQNPDEQESLQMRKILYRRSIEDKENSMKRNSSEERVRKELNEWLCNEMISQHEAELEESLWCQIEAR